MELVYKIKEYNVLIGIGLLVYAKTDTGCIIGTSALLEKGGSGEKVGTETATRLIYNLKKVNGNRLGEIDWKLGRMCR